MTASKTTKILLVGSKIITGGAERTLLNLAQWLFNQGLDITAVFFYDPSGQLDRWQKSYPFPIICVNAWKTSGSRFTRLVNLFSKWIRLIGWMRNEGFSAMLSFTHDSNTLALPAAWLAGIPIRYGSHHGQFSSLTPLRIHLHSKLINSRISSGLVATSSYIRNLAVQEGVKPERIKTILNGVDFTTLKATHNLELRQEILAGKRGPLVLNIGRLVVEKDQKNLIHAALKVIEEIPDALFVIAGEGALKDDLLFLVSQLRAETNVKIFGNRTDIPDLLAAADLFVLSSISEGLPISLLEAMAARKAVISTSIGGVADAIIDGVTGLLVPPEDPNALADAILTLIRDKPLQEKLAKNGYEKVVNHFSLDRMGEEYQDLLTR